MSPEETICAEFSGPGLRCERLYCCLPRQIVAKNISISIWLAKYGQLSEIIIRLTLV